MICVVGLPVCLGGLVCHDSVEKSVIKNKKKSIYLLYVPKLPRNHVSLDDYTRTLIKVCNITNLLQIYQKTVILHM